MSRAKWDVTITLVISHFSPLGMDMAKQKHKPVVVTGTDEGVEDIQNIAQKLSAKGMKVDKVMPITGVITGSLDSGSRAALKAVEGVHSVEDELEVHLPPDEV